MCETIMISQIIETGDHNQSIFFFFFAIKGMYIHLFNMN